MIHLRRVPVLSIFSTFVVLGSSSCNPGFVASYYVTVEIVEEPGGSPVEGVRLSGFSPIPETGNDTLFAIELAHPTDSNGRTVALVRFGPYVADMVRFDTICDDTDGSFDVAFDVGAEAIAAGLRLRIVAIEDVGIRLAPQATGALENAEDSVHLSVSGFPDAIAICDLESGQFHSFVDTQAVPLAITVPREPTDFRVGLCGEVSSSPADCSYDRSCRRATPVDGVRQFELEMQDIFAPLPNFARRFCTDEEITRLVDCP